VIASGKRARCPGEARAGEAIGTCSPRKTTPLAARKQWLADHLQVAGRLGLDAGATRALRSGQEPPAGRGQERGGRIRARRSGLLPLTEGAEIARGLVNYNAQESRRIAGRASSEIEAILGYIDEAELIHRDNLSCSSGTRLRRSRSTWAGPAALEQIHHILCRACPAAFAAEEIIRKRRVLSTVDRNPFRVPRRDQVPSDLPRAYICARRSRSDAFVAHVHRSA